jgi:hypothetical protein
MAQMNISKQHGEMHTTFTKERSNVNLQILLFLKVYRFSEVYFSGVDSKLMKKVMP